MANPIGSGTVLPTVNIRPPADTDIVKLIGYKQTPFDTQVGGDHYKDMAIQPIEYISKNKMGFFEGCVVKYVTRYKNKGGKQDLEKAIHMLELLIESEYPSEI